jgi:Na+(H+)/acetate symporter ActP
MLLALNPWGDIVEITAFSGSLYAACFLPSLVIGLFWKGAQRRRRC